MTRLMVFGGAARRNFRGYPVITGPVKVLFILSIAVLMAALPTLLTSCELICLSSSLPMAAQAAPASHCSGHDAHGHAGSDSSVPADERHDCGGHAVLSKAAGPPGVLPALMPAIVLGSLGISSPPSNEGASRDPEETSSPPPARSSPILRL